MKNKKCYILEIGYQISSIITSILMIILTWIIVTIYYDQKEIMNYQAEISNKQLEISRSQYDLTKYPDSQFIICKSKNDQGMVDFFIDSKGKVVSQIGIIVAEAKVEKASSSKIVDSEYLIKHMTKQQKEISIETDISNNPSRQEFFIKIDYISNLTNQSSTAYYKLNAEENIATINMEVGRRFDNTDLIPKRIEDL